jgi:predicted nucleic acid-binding protein
MARKILADSDFFIALYKKDDSNHKKAVSLLKTLPGVELLMSVFVYSEVATVLSQRVSQKTAHYFMDDIRTHGAEVIQSDSMLFEHAKQIFRGQISKNVSFTDVVNMALAQAQGIKEIVSFDTDYKRSGLALVKPKTYSR